MPLKRIILAAAIAAISVPVFAAEAITVGYKDVVTPDPALIDVSRAIVASWISATPFVPGDYDRFFAPSVKTFMKTETPLQPFEARDDITSDYLENAVYVLRASKGSVPDADLQAHAHDALSEIASRLVDDAVWGTLPEVPGMVCAGAAFDSDRQAVAKFSRMHGVRIDRLVLSRQAIPLYVGKTRNAEFVGTIPPHTLIAMGKNDVVTETWHPMIASTGIKGYADDSVPLETLAQKHVCFARVDGAYRIAALFGYGL